MIDPKIGTLAQHFPPLADLLAQIQHLLTDPAPGGLSAYKDELLSQVDQLQQLVDDAQQKVNQVLSVAGILEQLVTTLTAQLNGAGLVRVEIVGTLSQVTSDLLAQRAKITPNDERLYGILLAAATPDGEAALATLMGVGRTLGLIDNENKDGTP